MKKSLLALTLTTIMSATAFATIDSYVTVQIPVSGIHESGVCMIKSLAWDGVSNIGTKELVASQALNGPFKIHAMQAGEDNEGLVQANALYGSGVKVAIDVDMDSFNKAPITVDATEASSKAKTLEERAEVVRNVKIAIYAGIQNTISSMVKTAKVELKGLPNQTGIKGAVPAAFKSSFTKVSPYLATIKKELNMVDANGNCI